MKESVLLIDFDSKIPNLALMKLSSYYKRLGCNVTLTTQTTGKKMPQNYTKIFCSVVFSRNKEKAKLLRKWRADIQFGGTGWDLTTKLPPEVEKCKPDYNLYTADLLVNRMRGISKKDKKIIKAQELVNMGIGFTSRGCIRKCSFCVVPIKEGDLCQDSEIKDIVNPYSNIITLLDNNFTADPACLEKLQEIKERNLIVNISQGIDIRLITPEVAQALADVKHLRKVCYAWDFPAHEKIILEGIELLSAHIKKYRQMCYMLVGYNTTFEQDIYRFRKLTELGVDPYCMVYNQKNVPRLRHFARWINSRIYKKCTFDNYWPWIQAQEKMGLFVNELFIDLVSPNINQMQLVS